MKRYFPWYVGLFLVILVSASPVLAKRPTPTPPPEPAVKIVCLDPGHGGTEIGTSTLDGLILEKNVNLRVAELLLPMLEGEGYQVLMTRETDVNKTSAERYNYCNENGATILLSIHHNGATDPEVNYSLALYKKSIDVPLAEIVTATVARELGLKSSGISRFAAGVLLKSEMPATISEGFFLTSSAEYEGVKSEARLRQEAGALLLAVKEYFR